MGHAPQDLGVTCVYRVGGIGKGGAERGRGGTCAVVCTVPSRVAVPGCYLFFKWGEERSGEHKAGDKLKTMFRA